MSDGGDRAHGDPATRPEPESDGEDTFLGRGGALGGALGASLAASLRRSQSADDLAGQYVGSVEIVDSIGSGGFGRVYRGFDHNLERQVAVKVLRAERSFRHGSHERFRREARLLSKLDHPNICRVYGLVEEDGVDYLILEYVEGRPLDEAAESADNAAKLGLAADVAGALAAAHQQGIIHRDLKSDNVLVTDGGVAKVLDFGVARLETAVEDVAPVADHEVGLPPHGAGDHLTRRGARVGTVRNMSPEQARGEKVTVASDMFAFGLLLHELFGETPAYPDTGDDLLTRVERGEVEPFVHPDAELSALVDALERLRPSGRPTARQAVEVLQAIEQRPRRRRLRLLRRLAAVGVLAAMALGLLGWWTVRRQAARDVAAAEALIAEAQQIESRMLAESLSPLHDITEAQASVRVDIDRLAKRLEELGSVAAGPGHYGIGRAALAIGDLERALQEVQAAWDAGYRTPEVAGTLGRILARSFRDRVDDSSRRYGRQRQEEIHASLLDELAEPASKYLTLGRGARTEAPKYVDALLEVGAQNYEAALISLQEIDIPWFYERYLLQGWIERKLFRNQMAAGSIEDGVRHLERATDAYRRAIAIGRSDPQGYLGLCRATGQLAHRGRFDEARTRQITEEAIEACEHAGEVAPGSAATYGELAHLHLFLAQDAWDRGVDGEDFLFLAESSAEQGLSVAPESAFLRQTLVKILWRKAVELQQRGVDPRPSYTRGRVIGDALVDSDAATVEDFQAFVLLAMDQAIYESARGGSPIETLERGIEISNRSIAVEPSAAALANLSIFQYLLAQHQINYGQDPTAAIEAGLAAIVRALEALPGHAVLLRVLGDLHSEAFRHAIATGRDGGAALNAARQAFGRAREVQPDFVWARVDLIGLELDHARWQIDSGHDPRLSLDRCRRLLEELPRTDDLASERAGLEGQVGLLQGRWLELQGRSPAVAWRRAAENLQEALEVNSLGTGNMVLLAEVRALQAERAATSDREEARRLLDSGVMVVEQALAGNPNDARAHLNRARLLRLLSDLDPKSVAAVGAQEAMRQACALSRYVSPHCRSGAPS